jgi:hypothetical protein
MAAATIDSKTKHAIGDVVLITAIISAETTISATAVGLKRFVAAWLQDTGDGAGQLAITFTSTSLELSAAPAGGTVTVFAIGY